MSDNNLSKDTIQRLAFIKYLLNVAVGQSRQPEPLAAAAILTFHDSIEFFLQLACEHLNAPTKTNTSFMEYWEILKPKISGDGPTQKEAMKRLNKSRVSLKHHGILPTKLDVEAYRASVRNFFEDNTSLVFGVELENISMVNLVRYEAVKTRLEQAKVFKEDSELEKAMVEIAIAFKQLVDCYETPKQHKYGSSPFSFKGESVFIDTDYMGSHFEEVVCYVDDSLACMQDAIKILSFGLDYRKYARFQLLIPEVFQRRGNEGYGHRITREGGASIEDYKFCHNFVIESALHLQGFDFDTKS